MQVGIKRLLPRGLCIEILNEAIGRPAFEERAHAVLYHAAIVSGLAFCLPAPAFNPVHLVFSLRTPRSLR